MRISKKVRDNFDLYLRWYEHVSGKGLPYQLPVTQHDLNGVSAIEAFARFENQGKIVPCCETVLLYRALVGKEQLNLQMREWANGVAEHLLWGWELMEAFPWLPDWVWIAVGRQAMKLEKSKRQIHYSWGVAVHPQDQQGSLPA